MKIQKTRWIEAQNLEAKQWKETKNIIKEEWEEAYNKYHKYFCKLEKSLGVTDKTKILDVGCGPTCISRMIKPGKHYGIDPLAKKFKVEKSLKDIVITKATGEKIPYKGGTFHLVICRNAIDHTFSPEQTLKEISRILKPCGHLVLACYVYNPFINLVKNFGEMLVVFKNVCHPHTFSEKSFDNMANDNFEIIDRKTIYEGMGPNDFGKKTIQNGKLRILEMIIVILSGLLGYKWFVRERCLLCKKV